MRRDIKLERTYPHPPELVWSALTDPELLSEWLMPNDFVPELGHRFTMRSKPQPGWDGIVKLEVLELDAPRRMRWAWRGGKLDTEVSFTLEPAIVYSRPATKLVLEHRGFAGFEAVLVSFIMSTGWASMFSRIVPRLLDEVARGERIPNLRARMKAEHGMWRWLAVAFAPILGRPQRRLRP